MSDKVPLNVVLYWHMHQPQYKDPCSDTYHLPWTYLHAIKDYVDMAAHLENTPQARAVVNFTPTLLEQIDDYHQRITAYFQKGSVIQDEMLDALVQIVLPETAEQRHTLIKHCLRANEERLIRRYPVYEKLAQHAHYLEQNPHAIEYLSEQYIADLLVWFHLAWMGETVQRNDLRVRKLIDKAMGFTLQDRNELLRLIGELCGSVIPRYKALADAGKVELSYTPYAHPIMPLLLDINSAHEAMPDAPLPNCVHYPDGEHRVHWHIARGIEIFERYFGRRPTGCWPSEGSVSERTIEVLAEHGIRWLASGQSVLQNSLNHHTESSEQALHVAYRLHGKEPTCFFRDDGLSDMIGFTYATWHADDAVANLLHHLENIAQANQEGEQAIVSIILDGENAWEYYPQNGYYFLSALYKGLVEHPGLRLTTYHEYLEQQDITPHSLQRVVAGSWVYGTFSTWIGSTDKNLGWDMLCEAKRKVDDMLDSRDYSIEERDQILTQLAVCEGSDWFWWFGDYNPAESVRDFDFLYRLQLSHLYRLLGVTPPESLSRAFSHGGGHPSAGGTMRRGQGN